MTLGERLKEERKALGKTQEQFSAAVNISTKSQSVYERNKVPPNADYLAAIASVVDIKYIITGERSNTDPTFDKNTREDLHTIVLMLEMLTKKLKEMETVNGNN